MYTAISLRRENIAEYILYLWQIEDMMRVLGLDPGAIGERLVEPLNLDAERANALTAWYTEIASLLRQEGKEQGGHMQHTLHLIADLQAFHDRVLKIPEGERYGRLYAALEPELPALRQIIGREDVGDIELCFRALYAAMLYRIKGDEKIAGGVVESVSPVIAELARLYRMAEQGELDLFRERQ